jgi:hypothetical protein
MKSIIQDKKECFICRNNYDVETTRGLHEHHIFEGTGRRKQSEKYGLKVYLCYRHHNMDSDFGVHYQKALDLELKQLAQRKFEETHTREEFREHFIKSYL